MQVQFAQRKKFTEVVQHPLYMAKSTVLANHYFGFNGWSTKIVQVMKSSFLHFVIVTQEC